jgi:3-(3-hydroxy-phenyl)propionate hydroxylase
MTEPTHDIDTDDIDTDDIVTGDIVTDDIVTDVIIVGGGPVGVSAALFCHARGLRVAVVERHTDVYPLPRAISMDDEIQRAYASIGLGSQIAAVTAPMQGAEFVDAGGNRLVGAELPVDIDWPNGFHPVVVYHQPTLEHCLRDAATERGIELLLGARVDAIEDGHDGVTVTATTTSGDRVSRRGRWLIAADGASSPARKRLGVGLDDLGFDQEWIVVDARMHRDVGLSPFAQQVCDPRRVVTLVPGVEPWHRWELQMRAGESGNDLNTADGLAELLRPWIGPDDATIERSAVYRFHATVANRWRVGNAFLAGDAAHQMPPFLGQGLCSGVRDGVDLAWKLAAVAAGDATDALLDTYEAERLPHATATVHHAVDVGRLIDHLAAHHGEGDVTSGYGGGRPAPRIEHGLVIDAEHHPSVGRLIPNPILADGRRLDDHLAGSWAIVTADAATATARTVADRLAMPVVTVGDVPLPFVLDGECAAVVRPDRAVAAIIAGDDALDRLAAALTSHGMASMITPIAR